jgi:outer membrane protein TolC
MLGAQEFCVRCNCAPRGGSRSAQRARTEIVTAVQQNELALGAARQGYTEGAIDFLNVISVQAALLQSQSQLVNVDTEINTRLVGLYRSLGGGWEIAN